MEPEQPDKKRRGIYLLPNLFTTAALFAGFYSIVAAMKGSFDVAALAIFVAMIMDSLDGRVARLTNTQSDFGMEYDSLSDVVSFGVAPALVLYSWSLSTLGKFGWLVAFFYTATVALRLARFNIQAISDDKQYFQGLPCPAGAGVLASLVWVVQSYDFMGTAFPLFVSAITIAISLLMVSNIRYHSLKKFDLKGKVPFLAILLVVLLFIAISLDPPIVLLIGFGCYALLGPVLTLRSIRQRLKARKHFGSKPPADNT